MRNQYFLNHYPGMIKRRAIRRESNSKNPGLFNKPSYQKINLARIRFLESLEISFAGKTILDVGSGPGDLASHFESKAGKIVCVDAREENIYELNKKYPGINAYVKNVEKDDLLDLGVFDIVLCFGLLYHLENPILALRNIYNVCSDLLIIETMICDHDLPVLQIVDEDLTSTQALNGIGCRPSPSYLALVLNRIGFDYVYIPKDFPDHPDFHFRWFGNLDWIRNGNSMRTVIFASRKDLGHSTLVPLLK